MLAEIYINLPVKSIAGSFTYIVPPQLMAESAELCPGWRALVPFAGRQVEGFIVRVFSEDVPGSGVRCEQEEATGEKIYLATDDETGKEYRLKPISGLVDEQPWFTPKMLEAARRIADFYLCAPAEAMRLFMPGKSGVSISRKNGIRKREKAVFEKLVTLREAPAESQSAKMRLGPRQEALLTALRENGGTLSQRQLKEKYGVLPPTIASLLVRQLVSVREERLLRDSYRGAHEETRADEGAMNLVREKLAKAPALTDEQAAVMEELSVPLGEREYAPFLLYGITGSGKTRVYIEAVARCRQAGRQAIVLVPEIALTGQLVASFQEFFAGDIVVLHSRLSVAERSDAVRRVRDKGIGIIIGARSALFTPVEDPGLIILDEEQDMSYKQDEAPRYHARTVAEIIARLYGNVLLLGSATPSLETAYRAAHGELKILKLTKRIGGHQLPEAKSVDMREEFKSGNRHVLSRAMEALLRENLAAKEQTVLMLNRRGYSTFVMCRSCGYVVTCPDCGLPMVYHRTGRLACHHCDTGLDTPTVCPQCGGKYIRFFGTGTEKLEEELRTLLPEARVVRMDRDTTGKKFAHQEILNAFRRREYDILLGTQMVAKGHDIPLVTAVGIISADSALNLPDFRAAERTFMLITQAAGRAGRGDRPGRVLVQGYNPHHYAVESAIAQEYGRFYRAELALRRELFFPPFCRLVKITFTDSQEDKARLKAAECVGLFRKEFGRELLGPEPATAGGSQKFLPANQIIGPAPALIACYKGIYRFAVLIKAADLDRVRQFLRRLGYHRRRDALIDIDPINTV